MIREKGGAAVKLSQSNWVGRALATYLPSQVNILAMMVTMVMRKRMTSKRIIKACNLPPHSGHLHLQEGDDKNKMIVNADDEIEDGDADPS